MSGYDIYLIIKHLASTFSDGDLRANTENTEKYITILVDVVVGKYKDKKGKLRDAKIGLRLIDSQKLMQASLESLVENLVDVSKFSHIDSNYVAHLQSGKKHLSKETIQSKFRNLLANHTDTQFRLLL